MFKTLGSVGGITSFLGDAVKLAGKVPEAAGSSVAKALPDALTRQDLDVFDAFPGKVTIGDVVKTGTKAAGAALMGGGPGGAAAVFGSDAAKALGTATGNKQLGTLGSLGSNLAGGSKFGALKDLSSLMGSTHQQNLHKLPPGTDFSPASFVPRSVANLKASDFDIPGQPLSSAAPTAAIPTPSTTSTKSRSSRLLSSMGGIVKKGANITKETLAPVPALAGSLALAGAKEFVNTASSVKDAGTKLQNEILPNSDANARPGFPGENHATLLLSNNRPGIANFMGPGTHIKERVQRGDPPRTASDNVARTHDIDYSIAQDFGDIREADQKMVSSLNQIERDGSDSKFNTSVGKRLIQGKMAAEDVGFLSKDQFAGELPTGDTAEDFQFDPEKAFDPATGHKNQSFIRSVIQNKQILGETSALIGAMIAAWGAGAASAAASAAEGAAGAAAGAVEGAGAAGAAGAGLAGILAGAKAAGGVFLAKRAAK